MTAIIGRGDDVSSWRERPIVVDATIVDFPTYIGVRDRAQLQRLIVRSQSWIDEIGRAVRRVDDFDDGFSGARAPSPARAGGGAGAPRCIFEWQGYRRGGMP